jgi:hypothetical protein
VPRPAPAGRATAVNSSVVMITCREPMPKAYLDRACGARGGGGKTGHEAEARQQVHVKMGSGCGTTVTAWR